jgi:hypothetical protein
MGGSRAVIGRLPVELLWLRLLRHVAFLPCHSPNLYGVSYILNSFVYAPFADVCLSFFYSLFANVCYFHSV